MNTSGPRTCSRSQGVHAENSGNSAVGAMDRRRREYAPLPVGPGIRPRLVIEYAPRVIHYERARARRTPIHGGPRGETFCGVRFLPKATEWSRDARGLASRIHRFNSCPTCLVAWTEAA